jgi:hypothetical protein
MCILFLDELEIVQILLAEFVIPFQGKVTIAMAVIPLLVYNTINISQ